MKFSIVIAAHNSQSTIKSCLDTIFSSQNKDLELIVVDDNSSDTTTEIVKSYSCRLVSLKEQKGTAFARNTGANNAKGQILVFIDSDVLIKENTLDIIGESFAENKDIVAVTGPLSKYCPYENFFSQYKNLYMYYIFKRCPKYVDFLYGSIMVIKKEYFLPFNETFRITDDTELGQRYKESNKKILLNHNLEVIHLKKYNFKNIIQNDFFVPFWWTKSFILHKGYLDIFKKGGFSHARINQIISILTSYLFIFALLLFNQQQMRFIWPSLLLIFIFINYNFIIFLYKERGFLFMISSAAFVFVDSLIMGLGIITGLLYFKFKGLTGF